jgi:hypothetical protein
MTKTKGTRRAEDRRAARKQINNNLDPNVQVRHGYGGAIHVSSSGEDPLMDPV